jgi:hypothetical protein
MKGNMTKIPMKGGDEYDALTPARKYYKWGRGELKKIKRRFNKRFRKQGKTPKNLEEKG